MLPPLKLGDGTAAFGSCYQLTWRRLRSRPPARLSSAPPIGGGQAGWPGGRHEIPGVCAGL